MAVDALEDDGFGVLEVPSADFAVTLLETRLDIGMVFTDVTLPGTLNGFHLARLVRRTYPQVHVLIASGAPPPGFSGEAYEAHQLARRERRTVHVETVSPLLGHW